MPSRYVILHNKHFQTKQHCTTNAFELRSIAQQTPSSYAALHNERFNTKQWVLTKSINNGEFTVCKAQRSIAQQTPSSHAALHNKRLHTKQYWPNQ